MKITKSDRGEYWIEAWFVKRFGASMFFNWKIIWIIPGKTISERCLVHERHHLSVMAREGWLTHLWRYYISGKRRMQYECDARLAEADWLIAHDPMFRLFVLRPGAPNPYWPWGSWAGHEADEVAGDYWNACTREEAYNYLAAGLRARGVRI